jgi:hypothetical protein
MPQTWDDIIARGHGTADFRLRIEGVPESFVTEGMALGNEPGTFPHVRVPGLRRESLGFSESVYIAGAEHEVNINSVQIDDSSGAYRGRATRLFSTIARVIDQLTATLPHADVIANVRDSSLLDNVLGYMGTETINFDQPASATTSDITRGLYSSTAQTHHVTAGATASLSPIYDHPPGFVGRRTWLYAHGPGESGLSDAGTIVWRGVISKEPSERDGVWSLPMDSRTSLLDGPVAGGVGELRLRGIYYPGRAPFWLRLERHTGANRTDAVSDGLTIFISGFYETQAEFLAAIEAALLANATFVSWAVTVTCEETPSDRQWDLYFRSHATVPRWVTITGGSSVDGYFSGGLYPRDQLLVSLSADLTYASGGSTWGVHPTLSTSLTAVVADTSYRAERQIVLDDAAAEFGIAGSDLRTVPRRNRVSFLGAPMLALHDLDAADAAYPMGLLHFVSIGSLTVQDALYVTPFGAEEEERQTLDILSLNVATNVVIAYQEGDITVPPLAVGAGSSQPGIVGAVKYTRGDLAAMVEDLITRAPDVCNTGLGPWVTGDDLKDWSDPVEEASGGAPWLLERDYVFAKSQRTIEVLTEEWKLYGLIPYLNDDGKLDVRPMTFDTREPDHEIDDVVHIVDDGFGSTSGDDDGLVTVVHYFTGYDPIEDKHVGDDFRVRNLGAIARVHSERALEVRPKSNAVGADMGYPEAYARGLTITEIFGARRTKTVEIEVTIALFHAKLGDAVLLTIAQLPADGTRGQWTSGGGLTARTGYLVSRAWDLGTGRGTFRILLHELNIAGYAPSGKVDSASGAGTAWVLSLDAGHYSGTGSDAAFFSIGDSIRIREWDASSPVTREGVVTAVDTALETVSVTLSSAWAGFGAATRYTLSWDSSDDADTTQAQLDGGAFVAGPTGRIATTGTAIPAKRFAP